MPATQMTNQERNKLFLDVVDEKTKQSILGSIANHYGTDREAIVAELTENEDAEHILEYMVEPERSFASLSMIKHNLRGF
jgi:hypothetical protein